jgi:hypothetical protein
MICCVRKGSGQMRRNLISLSLSLAAMAPVSGFAADSTADLALVSVLAVDRYDQTELPTPSANAYTGFLSDQEMVRHGLANPYGDRPHELLLKVQFSSKTNLERFKSRDAYDLASTAFFCDRPKDNVFLSFSYVYSQGALLGKQGDDPIQKSLERPITYYMFLRVSRRAVTPATPPQVSFDLRQKADDICFYIGSTNRRMFGFRSNTVRITKDIIAATLQSTAPEPGK